MESLKKFIPALIILIISTTTYANDFCDAINENTYKEEIYLIPLGQIYQVTAYGKLYLYSAPNKKCMYGPDIFLIKHDKVQGYTEYKDFISIIYFKATGESIEGWALKEGLSRTNQRASP